jgi:hypothetical protein
VPAQLVPGGGDASFEKLPAAAGPSEILARLTAQKLSEHLGEQFYVIPTARGFDSDLGFPKQ